MNFFRRKEVAKEEEKFTGHVGCLSEIQTDCLDLLKEYIREENVTDSDRYTDHYLLRFCRARAFVLKDIKQMFKDFIDWRELSEVDEGFIIYDVSNMPEVKKFYKHGFHGTDKEGRPFYIDSPWTAAPIEDLFQVADSNEIVRNYILQFEYLLHVRFPAWSRAFGEKIDKCFSIVDLKGLSMGMFKEKSREFIKLPMGITQKNYPEIMHALLFINSPFAFKAIWLVLKPFIAKRTKDKIKILGSKYHDELFTYVDKENVPAEFGGDCTCEDKGGDCFSSDKGPWNDYPGDKYGEMYKRQLLGDKWTVPIPDPVPVDPLTAIIAILAPSPVQAPAPTLAIVSLF